MNINFLLFCEFHINKIHSFVSEKPNVTINCSNSITVSVGDDVVCLCEGKGGYPPADVTWYKNDVQIGGTRKEENILTLSNVDRNNNGTYVCIGKSYTFTNKASIEVLCYGKHIQFNLRAN